MTYISGSGVRYRPIGIPIKEMSSVYSDLFFMQVFRSVRFGAHHGDKMASVQK